VIEGEVIRADPLGTLANNPTPNQKMNFKENKT
jgi:hypothetical protein